MKNDLVLYIHAERSNNVGRLSPIIVLKLFVRIILGFFYLSLEIPLLENNFGMECYYLDGRCTHTCQLNVLHLSNIFEVKS